MLWIVLRGFQISFKSQSIEVDIRYETHLVFGDRRDWSPLRNKPDDSAKFSSFYISNNSCSFRKLEKKIRNFFSGMLYFLGTADFLPSIKLV